MPPTSRPEGEIVRVNSRRRRQYCHAVTESCIAPPRRCDGRVSATDRATRLICYSCGLAACKKCSTMRPHANKPRVRVCADCIDMLERQRQSRPGKKERK